jgi:AAA15 family ATPase/GTPase
MIDKIEIQNFKCFHEKHAFNLKNLNLFTGTNGKGKSSILQTFLLFRQSREMNVKSDRLLLNGNCVN